MENNYRIRMAVNLDFLCCADDVAHAIEQALDAYPDDTVSSVHVRREALQELLKQANNAPLSLAEEIILFYAFKRKILEQLPMDVQKKFIEDALSPAKIISVEMDDENHQAVVTVTEDQQSLAIGKGGQNVRLAAKLTGWRIDITSLHGENVASSDEDSAGQTEEE